MEISSNNPELINRVWEYFKNTNENSDEAIAKYFNLEKPLVSRIINGKIREIQKRMKKRIELNQIQ